MSGSDSGTGVADSSYTHYVYPGIYQNQDFHHCGLESGDDIVNYQNRVEVQTCELVNLAECVHVARHHGTGALAEGAFDPQPGHRHRVRAVQTRGVRERPALPRGRWLPSGRR